MIRVAIADDHQMVREGMKQIILKHPDMEVVGEAATGAEVKEVVGETDPDVLILDISMPGTDFLDIMSSICCDHPKTRVLVVSMHSEETWAVLALRNGAAGYLTKTHSALELAEGVRRVHGGGRYISPKLAEVLANRLGGGGGRAAENLSTRELQVLRKLGTGKMLKTVAREMGLSPKTVSTYKARVMKKLSLSSNADLVRFVMDRNLAE